MRNTGAELPVELGMRPGPATKIRHRWVCEKPVDLLLNLSTLSGVTIYIYPAEPMVRVMTSLAYIELIMQATGSGTVLECPLGWP